MSLRKLSRDVFPPVVALAILVLYGTLAFSYFENIDLFDSFYWTITVLSTVGFGDITPTTIYGKIVFISLIIFGLSIFGYFITIVTSFLTEERIIRNLFARVVEGGKMKNHVILLGWNSYIRYVYDEIKSNGHTPIVVIEDESLGRVLSREGYNVIIASINEEEFPNKVKLNDAKAIVISEEDTTKVILSILKIRRLNKDIPIIASYYEEDLRGVLLQAGANYLVNISEIGGRLLANQVFEPNAASVAIDLLSHGGLDLIEVEVPSKYDGKMIKELISEGLKSKIVIVKRGEETYMIPGEDFVLSCGDKIVLLGLSEILEKEKRMFS